MTRALRPVVTIARYVQIEALRSGLGWLAFTCILATLGAAAFASQVAITETREMQAAIAGPLLRLCAVFLVASHVIASVSREASDRGLEFALTLPLSRAQYYLGKLAGFASCAAILATSFALPVLAWSEPGAVLAWGTSLAAEAALIAAVALFFSTVLVQVVPALAATAGFYLLGRSISTIQAMAASFVSADRESALGAAVDVLALLLPRLDRATRAEWLLYPVPLREDWMIALGGLGIYFAIATAAGLFDMTRRNL